MDCRHNVSRSNNYFCISDVWLVLALESDSRWKASSEKRTDAVLKSHYVNHASHRCSFAGGTGFVGRDVAEAATQMNCSGT